MLVDSNIKEQQVLFIQDLDTDKSSDFSEIDFYAFCQNSDCSRARGFIKLLDWLYSNYHNISVSKTSTGISIKSTKSELEDIKYDSEEDYSGVYGIIESCDDSHISEGILFFNFIEGVSVPSNVYIENHSFIYNSLTPTALSYKDLVRDIKTIFNLLCEKADLDSKTLNESMFFKKVNSSLLEVYVVLDIKVDAFNSKFIKDILDPWDRGLEEKYEEELDYLLDDLECDLGEEGYYCAFSNDSHFKYGNNEGSIFEGRSITPPDTYSIIDTWGIDGDVYHNYHHLFGDGDDCIVGAFFTNRYLDCVKELAGKGLLKAKDNIQGLANAFSCFDNFYNHLNIRVINGYVTLCGLYEYNGSLV